MPHERNEQQGRPRARSLALAGAWVAAGLTAVCGGGGGPARGQAPSPPQVLTGAALRSMSPAQLDALYRGAGPGNQPRGRVHGLPIVAPGTAFGPRLSRAARLVWQGKVFRDDGASAVNQFFGARVIRGNLYQGTSWLDGRPALVLDYQGTSLVYGRYRDEIREVAPGLYLGLMYARTRDVPRFSRYFAFETRP